jgi:A/G-specific adenine glycosylase
MQIYEKLGNWYEKEKRDLPWRYTKDPYRIWISEIILQQTRVVQGTKYYNNFLEKFPDIFSLAYAKTDEILKTWQGLGYYSRARNMHETARKIVLEKNGHFPHTFEELLKYKGIGEYTAAAISSIVFNEPRATVDGNVKRVISRLFSVQAEINSPTGRKTISSLAVEILDPKHPGRHNQAVMELGARICLPKKPLCIECPVNMVCQALKEKKVAEFPVKYDHAKIKNRFLIYLIIRNPDKVWLQQRTGNDIWQGLYEFPLIEIQEKPGLNEYPALIAKYLKTDLNGFSINYISGSVTHKLSHRNIICNFIHISLPGELNNLDIPGMIINISDFNNYAIPKLIERYIDKSGF